MVTRTGAFQLGTIGTLMLACALSALVATVPVAHAHGWIQTPLARQVSQAKVLNWKFSRAGGNGSKHPWSPLGGVPGICGDPFDGIYDHPSSNFAGMPMPPKDTYTQGGGMTIQIDISANHGGFWEFSVCDHTAISQECFDRNKLKSMQHNSEQVWMLHRMLNSPTEQRPDSYFVEMKLPPWLVCDHCVLQWTWWTAHNCLAQECDGPECGPYADRFNRIAYPHATWKMPMCPAGRHPSAGQAPQMFRNCADFRITPYRRRKMLLTDADVFDDASQDGFVEEDEEGDGEVSLKDEETIATTASVLDGKLEESDSKGSMSGAGSAINCDDYVVQQVLEEINGMRKEVEAQPLECSNRSTGVAENFSEIMCWLGEKLDDSVDNCNMSGFSDRCSQIVVAVGGEQGPLDSINEASIDMLMDPSLAVGGVGHKSCDGVTYYTIILG